MYIYIYVYIYIVYMWQMSVFSHESAQRNDVGHLIYGNVFKTTRSFRYQWFRVSTHQANATKHGKSTLNLWIVVNRKKCKRFLNSKPITRRSYIHTFIYDRSFLACQTFHISNFTSEYTQLMSQNAQTSSYKATYHDEDTIYYNKFNSPNKPFLLSNTERTTRGGHLENAFIFWHSNRPYFLWRHNPRWRRRHKMQTASNASR